MSGHSKWSTIKHKKAATDAKRGKLFSKLTKTISVAARENGGDPVMNPRLRIAIETAQKANMPKDNIERAIKKGTGELEGSALEEIMLEIYGPEGVAILVEGITDNKNRTLSEIKKLLSSHNAKLASEGSVKWMFEQMGVIAVNAESLDKDELELRAIDAGAQDIAWGEESLLNIYTSADSLERTKQNLEKNGIKVETSELEWISQNPIEITPQQQEKLEKLFDSLDEYEDIQEIYSNIK